MVSWASWWFFPTTFGTVMPPPAGSSSASGSAGSAPGGLFRRFLLLGGHGPLDGDRFGFRDGLRLIARIVTTSRQQHKR